MMGYRDDEISTLERALTETYRSRPDIPFVEIDVTQDVMRAIRRSTGEGGRWIPSVLLDQIVWRTATIAAAVVLVVTILTVGMFRATAGENTGLLADEFETASLYGD
jgi:hypothetical protein